MFAALELLSIVVAVTSLVLAICLVFLPQRRERMQPVWCELRQLDTTVRLREYRQSGMITRCVLNCPLRSPCERCNEVCIDYVVEEDLRL